ncbi:3-deoxy-D-manno-octulosonic acid kinase [Colwellia chukchiensis]|uniref:3-deoxy-D-manno-octulosonic acid kinase n=1 Tax=Colwellia chukchiensis TaxID=641665 RepID=A0A1H7QSE2_9GAMM|nr:3-deoxy-D-manno-octulosonic acid kinase [Colwellia chukchiensis]SEL50545.1 3-deoxy-D-manno-octulosonic acid kinase [Colwellia chukchiensis]
MNQPAIVKPCHEKTFQQGKVYCRYQGAKINNFLPDMFDSHYWQQQQAIVGSAEGRGTTWFITTDQAEHGVQHWVLRHYYRGGLIGKVIHDHYFYTGMNNTRAAREFTLLQAMQELGLPAPEPVAFRIIKQGLWYQADLLSTRINNANDLVALLSAHAISVSLWQEIGRVIKMFHRHGIYHHDLNAHNILIDDKDKVWLIDFDQGEQRQQQNKWPAANLARLLRSFRKENAKLARWHWHEDNWQALLQGYNSN